MSQKESEWESRWEKEIPCICSDFAQQEDVGCDAHGEASLLIRRFIKKEIEKAYNKGYSDREKEIAEEVKKLSEKNLERLNYKGNRMTTGQTWYQNALKDVLKILKH